MTFFSLGSYQVGDIYCEKFEVVALNHDFGPWTQVIKDKYYFEDGSVLTEGEVNKRMWDLHRQKCDFHKDFKKRPKE